MIGVIIEKLKGIVDYNFILLVVGIGIVTLFLDVRWLKKQNVPKEAKLAKVIGITYIIAGPVLYLALKFI